MLINWNSPFSKMDKLLLLSISIVFLAWLINENIPVRRPPLVNYGELLLS